MSDAAFGLSRRRFLQAVAQAGAISALPQLMAGAAPAKPRAVPPSERITLGGIGIGHRGSYDLARFLEQPDVQVVAIADVKAVRRAAAKGMVDSKYGNRDCATYRDLRELLARPDIDAVLIATGPNWHATATVLAANAGKDVYCEKPCTKNIAQSLALAETFRRTGRVFQAGTQRRNLPHFAFAVELARRGRLGKLHTVYAHPAGLETTMSGWPTPEPEPAKEQIDWDLYLGPAAWRPFNRELLDGFNFEKGGGLVGGGCLEWGSHCVDLCQWAAAADGTSPVQYNKIENGRASALYANGVKLVLRNDGWLPLGSCPVRFEGETGWVEAGDSGRLALSSPALLAGRKVAQIADYPATFHIRDFLDCVKSRGRPLCNADVACHSHITCHAVNVSLFLGRQLKFDPRTSLFLDDAEANRLRGEALREPWRL